jgi:LacI family transcriptional regulator
MADVARICRVTEATVSRVLNHKTKNFSTTEAVRKRILDTTRELGYAPNLTARALSERNTRVVGLFASPQTHVAEGINESMFEGIAETLHAGGYEVFFGLSPSVRSAMKTSPSWRLDGAILMQAPKPETVAELDVRRVPYVCVNERVGRALAYVLADDAMGMNRAISHLTQLGHRRFAYANARSSNATHYSVHDRYRTLLSAAQNQSIQLVEGHEMPFNSPEEFLRKTVLEQGASAVIAYEHRKAVMLLGAARRMGLRVPEDFSLICFNDVFPVAMLHPPLTAVVVAGRTMGQLGADLLLNHLLSPQSHSVKEIRVAEDLIVRDSTAPPKGE